MKYYQITSKKTGRIEVIDEDTKSNMDYSMLKKFNIEELPEPKKIIPEEIVKKVNKQKDND
jgi:hypothetical protein